MPTKIEELTQQKKNLENDLLDSQHRLEELKASIRGKEKQDLSGEAPYGAKDRKADESALASLEKDINALVERVSIIGELVTEEEEAFRLRQISLIDRKLESLAAEALKLHDVHRATFDRCLEAGLCIEEVAREFAQLASQRAVYFENHPDPSPPVLPVSRITVEFMNRLRNARIAPGTRRSLDRLPLYKSHTESLVKGDPATAPLNMISDAVSMSPGSGGGASGYSAAPAALNATPIPAVGRGGVHRLIPDFQSVINRFRV